MNAISNLVLAALILWGGYNGWKAAFRKAPHIAAESNGARGSNMAKDKVIQRTEDSRSWFSSAPVALKLATFRPDSTILIYGQNDINAKMTEETLRFKGFSKSVLIPIESINQFQDLGIAPALTAAGLVNSRGATSLPFYSVDGQLYSQSAFEAGLAQLPLTKVRERETPYITIYGPAGCPFTLQGRQELDANGFQYEVRDVNDPRYRPRFEALVRAYEFKTILWPMIDISGRLFSKPSIENVRENYR